MTRDSQTVRILGVDVRMDFLMTSVVAKLCDHASAKQKTDVAFVNADCLNIGCKNPEYRAILNDQNYVLPDGMGVRIAGFSKGIRPRENLNGTDMLPVLCEMASKRNLSLFLLGAKPGVTDKVEANLTGCFPELRIAGTHHGYLEEEDEARVVDQINASDADFLLVAFGAPRQEIWLAKHRDALEVPVRIGVGGLFDFFSGNVPRAPRWMRKLGLEWLFRLKQEPRRLFKRYVFGNPLFLLRIFRDLFVPLTPAADRKSTDQS